MSPAPYIIEAREAGVWVEIDTAADLDSALQLASSRCPLPTAPAHRAAFADSRIQIVTPDCRQL